MNYEAIALIIFLIIIFVLIPIKIAFGVQNLPPRPVPWRVARLTYLEDDPAAKLTELMNNYAASLKDFGKPKRRQEGGQS
jgi:hypothetical protein